MGGAVISLAGDKGEGGAVISLAGVRDISLWEVRCCNKPVEG